MRLLPLPAVILALASSIVHADDRLQVTAVPVPWLVQGEAAGALGYPTPGASASATDSLVYSNTNYSAGYIFSSGAGVQFADDIHLTLPGRLTQFFFFFVETEPTPIRFTVAYYANYAGDTGIGARLGGPYVLGPFRWGAYPVHATVQHDTVQLDRDAWFGVSNVTTTRNALFFFAALQTGGAVAVSGVIGFVGLVAPHIMRSIIGPDNRKLILDTVTEMLSQYRFDGIQYDYIRYSEEPSCYCSTCKREFERVTGLQIANWPVTVNGGQHTLRYRQWRQDLINEWVRTLTVVARQTNPHVMVSAAVFSDLDRSRVEKSQDWQLWLQRGYVDYVCTMTYTTKIPEFEGLIRKQQDWVSKSNQLVVGIGSWKMNDINELNVQIGSVRRLGTAGFALFSYDDMEARAFYPMVSSR